MKAVAIDDVLKFRYLAQPTFSPEGKSAAFVLTEADRKANGYRSFLYLLRDGAVRQLTSFGKESSFRYLDEDTILFPGCREEKAEGEIGSIFYTISLSGGEAKEAFRFPIPVSKILPLPDGNLIVLGKTFPGYERLYTGDAKLLAAFRKDRKENEDYEEIAQVPWWWNGITYTKGAYESLFFYDVRKRKLRRLSEENEAVSAVNLSADGRTVYYVISPVGPLLHARDEDRLMRRELAGGQAECLFASDEKARLNGYSLGEHFILLLLADLRKNGRNSNGDFYKLDYAGGEIVFYAADRKSVV